MQYKWPKEIVYFSLWEDVGILVAELKLNKMLVN